MLAIIVEVLIYSTRFCGSRRDDFSEIVATMRFILGPFDVYKSVSRTKGSLSAPINKEFTHTEQHVSLSPAISRSQQHTLARLPCENLKLRGGFLLDSRNPRQHFSTTVAQS